MQEISIVYNKNIYSVSEGSEGLWYTNDGYVFTRTDSGNFLLYTTPKFLHYKKEYRRIRKCRHDGLWRFDDGTIAGISEEGASVDTVDRCGVGILSLPSFLPITDACRPHDFAYSSKAYQVSHTRQQADAYLEFLTNQISWYSVLAEPFYYISRLLGARLWEVKATNN